MRAWMGAGVLAVFLGGCASSAVHDPSSPYYGYGSRWTAQLFRPLAIPAGAATVRLQYGEVVPANSVQEHDPFCVIELDSVGTETQTLRTGRFEVLRVTRSVSPIAAAAASDVLAWGFDDGASFLYYITEFGLRDPDQPELRGMRCAWNQLAPGNRSLMRHLTLEEIHSALGRWMRLTPAKEAP